MKKVFMIIITGTMLVIFGCNKNSTGPTSSAPTLPANSTMSIPSFGSEGTAKVFAGETQSAFGIAYLAVSYWTINVNQALLPPRALFAIAHSTIPVPLADNSGWKWTIGDTAFSAVLICSVENDSARWSMTVTGNNLSNFTWFTGASTITGNAGSWIFYDTTKVNSQYLPVFNISYDVTGAIATAKVENIKAGAADLGSYLQWGIDGTARSFAAHDAVENKTVNILWDSVTEDGSIQEAGQTKYCWDTRANNHQDITCP